jgi:hypothetical protein
MPRKTFAQGRAGTVRSMVRLAMDRPRDQLRVIVKRADDRMLFEKGQRRLRHGLTLEQLAQRPQPIRAV